ncbi:sigma-70 family RNA polymerase sigma factor [Olivibacter sp. SDN3]|uniref:RNA polymerase sigma factor n=1 Tax=Olivibacter sp. SDN3 TaxID=2764720 RepID=UPI0016512758|nr:sigma-70 family RNA polymerase sigma factor [Olivibacter sp. SDN3]QNL47976.1 sigma-70 family RNA polymerase sigma factor [Olivibacter sp. SDN3]
MPHKNIYTEEELISLLISKEEQGYNYLYDNYAAALYGVVVRVVGESNETADILQDSFVKIWQNIDQYDPAKGRLFTWMLKITRNLAIDYMRSADKKRDSKTHSLDPGVHIEGNETYANIDHLGLKKVLGRLKNEYRIVIEMAYFQGYTQDEISKELDIPLGTIKTRARAALMQLKQILN